LFKISYKTTSSKQTKKLAGLLAAEILRARLKQKNALVLALSGDLGAGKTTFVQGFLRGLGIKKKITSPTFVIVKSYKVKSYKVYHIDCYRIKKPKELFALGFQDILHSPFNIALIEWAEKIRRILPKNTIWLKFKHGEKENIRKIIIH
jgi:tRNA threonylcarbamoyladenosine biosynthesis protein TsaE